MTHADTGSAGWKEDEMSDLRAARLTGALFIIATAADLIGAAVRPSLAGAD